MHCLFNSIWAKYRLQCVLTCILDSFCIQIFFCAAHILYFDVDSHPIVYFCNNKAAAKWDSTVWSIPNVYVLHTLYVIGVELKWRHCWIACLFCDMQQRSSIWTFHGKGYSIDILPHIRSRSELHTTPMVMFQRNPWTIPHSFGLHIIHLFVWRKLMTQVQMDLLWFNRIWLP